MSWHRRREWMARHGESLTPRQADVLVAVVNHGTAGAPSELGISPGTLKGMLAEIRAKLGAQSTTHAAALAYAALADRYEVGR